MLVVLAGAAERFARHRTRLDELAKRACEAGCWLSLVFLPLAAVADWPTYRADASRSGFTTQSLADQLTPLWSYDAGEPSPAWPRSGRLPFDRAYHCVVAGEHLFFASSSDHALYRLDVASGVGGTIFTSDGPIRFAPTIWKDRLFLVSDDGYLYCLSFEGEIIWKHRGGPSNARRLGNDQLISKWPARGAPAVVGDTVFYAAGIWPSDEIFVQALDCHSGRAVWINDDSGGLQMPQPHGGADAQSGVSAQVYLVVSGPEGSNVPFPLRGRPLTTPATAEQKADAASRDAASRDAAPHAARLLVPTGRAVPASFDLHSGKFEYFHLQQYGQRGGFATMAVGPMFFNSGIAFDAASGAAGETLGAGPIAAFPGGLVRSTENQIVAYRWVQQEKADRRGRAEQVWGLQPLWTADGVDGGTALVVADQTVVAAGNGTITLLDLTSGNARQSLKADGNVYGLAISKGRLIASTDTGKLLCFTDAATNPPTPIVHHQQTRVIPPSDPAVVAAAEEILADLGSGQGYCLDFGCGDGRLAYELAIRSDLQIYAIDDDAQRVSLARQRLHAAGLYGRRVTVHHVKDLAVSGYPNYFANLIVSGRSLGEPGAAYLDHGWQSAQRPYGGVAQFGPAGHMRRNVRGPLEGAGQWTHQYGSAANELCSSDERLQGPLGMLWYRDVAIDVPQRHGRAPAPLFYDGLLYHEGLDEIVCVDAYNGVERWRYALPGILKAYDGDELMGVSGTGSNYCIGESGVYIRRDDHCLRLDRRTGELLGRFTAPPQPDGQSGTWGYLALEDGQLFGSLADREHQVTFRYRATTGDMSEQLTESVTLFAVDPITGQLRWRYDAKDSIRHNAIAVGDEQVFLIDRPLATFDRTTTKSAQEHPAGVLIALDAKTGEQRWRNDHKIDGTTLSLSTEYRRLLMSYQPTRFALASEIGGRLAAFSTHDGKMTWEKRARYATRPLINSYTVYAQGGAWDLLSGEERPFNFSRSYGCGILAGSRYMMVYRSATLGYFDLLKNERTENYGGMRPGCWINALPAGGLVLVPDASAGCVCSYLNQAWMALEPVAVRPPSINPPGGAFRESVEIRLSHEDRGATIHYTLDGSSPVIDSPRYSQPLKLADSSRVRARAFRADGQTSRPSDAQFLVDRDMIPLDDARWRVWDVVGNVSSAPSDWSVDGDVVSQRSNIYRGSATESNAEQERYGTLRIYDAQHDFDNGEIELDIRSADDGGLGIAFRFQDENRHYLWASDLQRKFRVLAVKDGNTFRVLAKNDRSYQKGVWQHVKITLQGDRIIVHVDGEEDFSVVDNTFGHGTVALHSWGSDSVEFRRLRMRPQPQQNSSEAASR